MKARLCSRKVALLVCDVQERFRPILFGCESVVDATKMAVRGANVLNVPVIVTEQYPKALGNTLPELRECFVSETKTYEKLRFSMCIEQVSQELKRLNVSQILLCGVEAHVCVLQTAQDLLVQGYDVHLLMDAITSQRSFDRSVAMRRMMRMGCVPNTTEMALFEMLEEAQGDAFRAISRIVKEKKNDVPKEFSCL